MAVETRGVGASGRKPAGGAHRNRSCLPRLRRWSRRSGDEDSDGLRLRSWRRAAPPLAFLPPMDAKRAQDLATNLSNREVGGWRVEGYVNHGKSAVVLRATKPGQPTAALKVFDQELIERFGHDVQIERVSRELDLRGKHHPHLVEILDGGTCKATNHIFLVTRLMEGWRNLAECLQQVPPERTSTLLEHVASAAQFLETQEVVHRDIKPANIVIDTAFENAVLLDLGVIQPLNASSITDDDSFVGTLQYSSPEFLFGDEERTLEGGRALTFYQLGAVLHDLLLRTPLFAEHRRYPRMVEAVKHLTPRITSKDPYLAQLARNCLLKDPKQRLALVSWQDFYASTRETISRSDAARKRIRDRLAISRTGTTDPATADATIDNLVDSTRTSVQDAHSAESILPPCRVVRFPEHAPDKGFDLILARSSPHGLTLPLCVRFVFRPIGDGASAVEVSGAAVLTAGHPSAFNHWNTVFRGATEHTAIATALMSHMLLLVDHIASLYEDRAPADPTHVNAPDGDDV